MHIVGDQTALQTVHIGQYIVGHRHPVGAAFLGNRNGDSRSADRRAILDFILPFVGAIGGAGIVGYDVVGVVGAFGHQRNIADIDHLPVLCADHQVFNVAGVFQERAGLQRKGGLPHLDRPDRAFGIGRGNGLGDLVQPDAKTGQPFGEDFNPYRIGPSAGDKTLRGGFDFLQPLQHVQPKRTQARFVQLVRPQGQGDNRHIIHPFGADQRLRYAGGDAVKVGLDFIVQFHQ